VRTGLILARATGTVLEQMAADGTARHLKTFSRMISHGKLHAPNLKVAHVWLHKGEHRSNRVVK
jgi:hypothetical protein